MELAFAWLAKGIRDREPWMPWVGTAPGLSPIREDPRFDDVMRQIGLR